jgi:hypothetical protein
MALKWIVPVTALVTLGSVTLPAQSAPLGVAAGTNIGQTDVQQAHYGYRYRHHRYYRYYREPGFYFSYGPRYRHWRHHRHWW